MNEESLDYLRDYIRTYLDNVSAVDGFDQYNIFNSGEDNFTNANLDSETLNINNNYQQDDG